MFGTNSSGPLPKRENAWIDNGGGGRGEYSKGVGATTSGVGGGGNDEATMARQTHVEKSNKKSINVLNGKWLRYERQISNSIPHLRVMTRKRKEKGRTRE